MSQDAAPVAQALYFRDRDELRFAGKSADFADGWVEAAESLCRGFGPPLAGVACPEALIARPLGPRHVAVVQVADRPGGLGFRVLALPRVFYAGWIGDPFLVSERFPPDWSAKGELPTLTWPAEAPPRRTVAQLQQVLQTGGSQTLLGAVQALVDGSRVVFERAAPAPQLVRDLWALLPNSSRAELWPATFAYGTELGFDVLVVPPAAVAKPDRYLTEEQVVDYPEGRYEFSLQYAIEHDDQRELNQLLRRPGSRQRVRLLFFLVAGVTITYIAINAIRQFL
ncbi:MAG: hypothetical protein ACJ8F7_05230 [Gemmataceae bacterium]